MKDILSMTEEELNIECANFMDTTEFPWLPQYSKSLDLMYKVEERLKEIGKHKKYAFNLAKLANESPFAFIHASPLDRLKAVLLTIQEVEK